MSLPMMARIKSSGKYLYDLTLQLGADDYYRFFRANNLEEANAFAAGWINGSNLHPIQWHVSSTLTYPRELKGRESWGDAAAERAKLRASLPRFS